MYSNQFLIFKAKIYEIEISKIERSEIGTSVELKLQEDYLDLCRDEEMIEESIKQFADFISVPIFLNEAKARTNLINAAWFDETPDYENLEMELVSYFEEQREAWCGMHALNNFCLAGKLVDQNACRAAARCASRRRRRR